MPTSYASYAAPVPYEDPYAQPVAPQPAPAAEAAPPPVEAAPPQEYVEPQAAPASAPGTPTSYASYAAPQEATPAPVAAAPQESAAPQTANQAPANASPPADTAPATAAPASTTNTYVPGTNRVLDALFTVGDKVGDVVEAVGGPETRKNLEGFAPPVKEIAEAPGVLDKVIAASDYWDRPAQQGQEAVGDAAIAAQEAGETAGSEPYSLTSKEGIGTALGQFAGQIGDYVEHPEHILSAIPQDSAEGSTVFGDQGFNDWAAENEDKVTAVGGDGDALYQEYLRDIGYSQETGGLGGLGKGLVQQALTDESLLPTTVIGGAARTLKAGAEVGKVGMARGVLGKAGEAVDRVIQGPEDFLLDEGASLLSKAAGKVPGLKSIFSPSAEKQQTMASETLDEVSTTVTGTRSQMRDVGTLAPVVTPAVAPTPQATPLPAAPAATATPTTGVPLGGRPRYRPPTAGQPSSSAWTIDPQKQVLRDGQPVRKTDLAAARDEWINIPPGAIYGFDQDVVGTIDPKHTNLAAMRGALHQGFVDIDGTGKKVPYFVNDVSKARMVEQKDLPLERKAAGSRFIAAEAKRIEKYGATEVERVLRDLNNTKYRGVQGNTQPVELWHDNQRLAIADALRASGFSEPVDLGFRHKLDPLTGRYVVDPKRPIRINPQAPGTLRNIRDYEPDAALWQSLQNSAAKQGNPGQFRVTTPPAGSLTPATSVPATPALAASTPIAPTPFQRTQYAKSGMEAAKYRGVLVADGQVPYLEMKVGEKTFFDTIEDAQDDLWTLHDAVQGRQTLPDPVLAKLTDTATKDYKALYGNTTEPDFAAMSLADFDRFAANVAHKRWYDTLPPQVKKTSQGMGGKLLQLNSDIVSFRSAVGLHNWAAAPRQMVVQSTGNMWTMLITKPAALTSFLDPRRWKALADAARIARQTNAKGPWANAAKTDLSLTTQRMGLGTNAMITNQANSLAGDAGRYGIQNSMLGKLKTKLAPDVLRDWTSLPDNVARDAIGSVEFTPRVLKLQKGFGRDAARLTDQWVKGGKYGQMMIPPTQVERAINDAFSAHYTRRARVSEISAPELEQALLKQFENAPNQSGLPQLADRIARDYQTQLNTIHQQTARETRRVLFSWDSTRLDDSLRHAMLYHYWTSRASGLYVKTMAQNPWLAGSLVRLAQAAHEESVQNDYPLWMQGMSRLMSSSAGSILFANPFSMISAAFVFADWQYGMEPEKFGSDLTDIGRWRGILPVAINPIVDSAAWGLGKYGGEDAGRLISDPTGAERIPKMLIDVLNLAGVNGHLPGGMLTDANGNFQPLPNRPLTELWAKFASSVTGVVRENPQPIPNLFAAHTTAEQAHLLDILVEDHPDWDEDLITRTQNTMLMEAEQGTASPEVVEAQKRALEGQMRGPEFEQLPEGLRGVVGAVVRQISPMQMLNRPEMSMTLRATPVTVPGRPAQDLPEFRDEYDAMDMGSAIYKNPETTAFKNLAEDSFGNPELNAARDIFYRIGSDGGSPEGETVGGIHYSQEQIRTMTDARRWQFAREALEEQGFSQSDIDAQNAQMSAMEEANPDLAAYKGWTDQLNAMTPEERKVFIDDTYANDPAFARMMDKSPYEPQSEDWYNKTPEWAETFRGAQGERVSQYDPLSPLPEGEAISVPELAAARADTRAAYGEKTANSFPVKVERSINEYRLANELLEQEYPGYGYTAGAGNLPPDVWTHMKEVWGSADIDTTKITKPYHYGAEYMSWVASNPEIEDISVQSYLDAHPFDDGSNQFANGAVPGEEGEQGAQSVEAKPIDLNGGVDYDWVSQTSGRTKPATTEGTQIAFPASSLNLRQSPNGHTTIPLTTSTALRVLGVENGWAHVALPTGGEGYVLAASLRLAA